MPRRSPLRRDFPALALSMLCVYALFWALTGRSPLFSTYDSYVLQALRWLSGHLDLGQDYAYLEIARYAGRYFVSFPPIPSVLLLPLCLLFGANAPDGLLAVGMSLLAAWYALRLAHLAGRTGPSAVFWALFLTVGSNFLHVGPSADVWYLAQTCAFAFTLMALYHASTPGLRDGWVPLLALALAFGCRPLQIVYLPLAALLLWQKVKRGGLDLPAALRRYWWWALPPLAVGCALMALNAARFGSPFQFGHDYLPEFAVEKPAGQFSAAYLPENWARLWALPPVEGGRVVFPIFNGCAFWLFSPIFLSFGVYFLKNIRAVLKKPAVLLAVALILVHFAALCAHATLGGWQFGNRYTVDALPVLYWALLLLLKDDDRDLPALNVPLFLWGLGLDLVGSVALFNGWLG